MWEAGKTVKVKTSDVGKVEGGVEEVGGHVPMGLHPQEALFSFPRYREGAFAERITS